MKPFHFALGLGFLLALPTLSWATILHVPGDYTQINQATAAASPGDSIAVGPGTYAEGVPIVITVQLTLYSTDGADATILDGEDTHRILWFFTAKGALVRGFTFVNGVGVDVTPAGGAVLVSRGAEATIEDCVLRQCTAESGGAIYVSDSDFGLGTTLIARGCVFDQNTSTLTGGAAYVVLGAEATFLECTFRGNGTQSYAGAVQAHQATMNFDHCLFKGNSSSNGPGALYYGTAASGYVRSCTFFSNQSGSFSGTILSGSGTHITQNVIAGELVGFGVYGSAATRSCNVFWNNAAGAVGSGSLMPTEVVADPLFCDPSAGDFRVSVGSPCLPGGVGSCGLIGAFGQGCGIQTVITAQIWFGSAQLNVNSGKKWLIAYIQPPTDYQAADIDFGSILLFGNVPGSPGIAPDPSARSKIGDQNHDGVPDLMVGFSQAAVGQVVTQGDAIPIFITGLLAGTPFRGETTLKVTTPSGQGHHLQVTLGGVTAGPREGKPRVTFNVSGEGAGQVEIFDVTGRRLTARTLNGLESGEQTVEIKERIPAGVYVIRFTQGGKAQSKQTVLLH